MAGPSAGGFGDPGTGTINEANLNGTGVTTLLTGQNRPIGVAIGP